MKEFTREDRQHLRQAEGWLGLNDLVAANEALDLITPELRAHPDVLQLRTKLYVAAGNWEMVQELGQALQKTQPEKSFGVIHHAFALRMLHRPSRAYDILVDRADKFPNDWRLAYQVVHCCVALGDFEKAREWAKKTFEQCPDHVKLQALDDRVLNDLWSEASRGLRKHRIAEKMS